MKLKYKVEIWDKTGKIISCVERESKSFVQAYAFIMNAQMDGNTTPAPAITTKDTGNTSRNLHLYNDAFRCNAGITDTNNGIRVGTSSQAVDMTDYAMIAAITEGVGAGQLQHQVTTVSTPSVAGPTCSFTVTRSITNASGGAIVVEECGIYGRSQDTGNVERYFLLCRDLTGTQAVPDGGGITVTYTLSSTV